MASKSRFTLPTLTAFLFMGMVYTMLVSGASIKAVGTIESTSGGFVFPDGSVQMSASVPNCTPITSIPITISEAGIYCLTNNLNTDITSGYAIEIQANDVVIDLNGWRLDGFDAGTATEAVGIYAWGYDDVTIRNGTIRGFYYGVHIQPNYSKNHLIEDIQAKQNWQTALRINGVGSIIRRNRIVDTGGSTRDPQNFAWGMRIQGSGVRVLNNDVINTVTLTSANAAAIDANYSDGTVIENNRIENVRDPLGWGMGINVGSSNDVLVIGNRITNADRGINYWPAHGFGKYMDNLTSGVGIPFTGGTPIGIND